MELFFKLFCNLVLHSYRNNQGEKKEQKDRLLFYFNKQINSYIVEKLQHRYRNSDANVV